jgi:hypothetical protein
MSGTLHFIHVGKTGGSVLAGALVRAQYANWASTDPNRPIKDTPYGRINLGGHALRMPDIHSRLNRGQPRYYYEWTEREKMIFEVWQTPQALAAGLLAEDPVDRQLSEWGMANIRHLHSLHSHVGTRSTIRLRKSRVVYIARQETLADDWNKIRRILGVPEDVELTDDPVKAHKRNTAIDELTPEVQGALRKWYAKDYRLLNYCERLRAWNGWGPDRTTPEKLRGAPALIPPPPLFVRKRLKFL